MKKEVVSKKSSAAIGPYSHGIEFGNLVFVSGQIGVDPKTNNLFEGIKEQTKQALVNLKNVLEAGKSDINNVLKTTVYLADMNDFPIMNEVYATFFKKPYPARATIQVTKLPKGALVEIECMAYRKDKKGCCDEGCQCNC